LAFTGYLLLTENCHAVQQTETLIQKAREEYKYRQIGLIVSIGVIGLLMLTIYLKLRQVKKP
jgi:hypothetical protein